MITLIFALLTALFATGIASSGVFDLSTSIMIIFPISVMNGALAALLNRKGKE